MNAAENPKCKNERQEMFPFEKTELLDKLDKEISIVVIRHKYGLKKSIIFYIKKNRKKISESITARVSLNTTIPCCNSS
jgi:hypothetical protein